MSSGTGPRMQRVIVSVGQRLLSGLQDRVRKRLRSMGDVLETKVTPSWVSFRSRNLRRVFAEVRAHCHDIEAFILPPVGSLAGADGIAFPSPPTQGWGWFQSKFRVTRTEELAVAADLLLQSYTLRREMSRKGSHGLRAREPDARAIG